MMAWPLALTLAFTACEGGTKMSATVMTRNVYVGADIDQLLRADARDIPGLAAKLWQDVAETDFAQRAAALADEIAAARPHLVGLQEVSLFRRQTPGDYLGGNATAAEDTTLDFLSVLLEALAARDLSYRPVAVTTDFDIELPMATRTGMDDIRLTDRDAILVRSDVTVAGVEEQNFEINLEAPVGGGELMTIRRGWVGVDATIDGVTVRFVSTHLEPPEVAPQIQTLQAQELRTRLSGAPFPVILVGDLNTNADGSSTSTYADFRAADFGDAWEAFGAAGAGNTCCHAADLQNPTPELDKRIDYILFKGDWEPTAVEVIGNEIADRTPGGLWPSDHAGVVATLNLGTRSTANR
jgi:endonuclease/exonuclease/phosphatase family metal-dependent hydrolase